jgi:hypothetical protein
MNTVKYPAVKVRLVGEDGNAFAIMGRVVRAMRRAKLPPEAIDEYRRDATSGDYNHLLAVTMATVTTDSDDDDDDNE